ncbi:MAG: CpXC domain-containing protein [Eubacterium sp.]|nr:CpXC domain-containing protein [Eubacterium sp.]
MDYRLGNNKKIKEVGHTVDIVCPKCSHKVKLSVFSNAELRLTPELPIVSNGTVYFLVCPSCGAVFGVDEDKGNIFKKGEKLAIGNFDLKELKSFHEK